MDILARRPRLLEQEINKGIKPYHDRDIESIFLGKVENSVQHTNRTQDNWFGVVEKFSLPIRIGDSFNWPYSHQEYLDLVSNSKFGLCLAGYGPKCNREIEYFGLGVVPIVSPEVDMTYYNPLTEGKHYFRANSSEEFTKLIKNCSISQWEDMSNNVREWYASNCSRQGSFETTVKIVESL